VRSFFEEGKLLRQINHTLIALIPKVSNPTRTNQFWPISLCNTIYKIISKIMSNHMHLILEKVICPIQSALVPKRFIHDNILLAHEIMNKFKNMKGKKAWVALKLDMTQVYNRVEWNFLFSTLHKFDFHPTLQKHRVLPTEKATAVLLVGKNQIIRRKNRRNSTE